MFRRMKKNRRLYIGNDSILPQDAEFERFVRFVHDALKAEMGGTSIWRLIAEGTQTDDEAFDLFFLLLSKFDEQQSQQPLDCSPKNGQ